MKIIFKKEKIIIHNSITVIYHGTAQDNAKYDFTLSMALSVLTALMNKSAVQLFNGQMFESKHAIEAYCHFLCLLMHFIDIYPDLDRKINNRIEDFTKRLCYCNKSVIPDVGKFLIQIVLSSKYKFVEIDIQPTDLPHIFQATKVSNHLLIFDLEIAQTFIFSEIDINNDVERITAQLRQINDYVIIHTELDSCMAFIQSIYNERIFFVLSIHDISRVLSHIATLSQIESIFIFNWDEINDEHLVVENSKLIGVYDKFDALYLSIQKQVEFFDEHFETFSFFDLNENLIKDLSKQTADLLWFQLYHDILLQLTYDKEAKQELIDACRTYYQGNIKQMKMINKFENEYRSNEALQCWLQFNKIRLNGYVPIANSLCSFDKIFLRQIKCDEALIFHQRALTILEEYYQFPHIDIALNLEYLVQVLVEQKNYNEAFNFLQQAMSFYKKYYPNDHVKIAASLYGIGIVYFGQGKYDKALSVCEQVLKIFQKHYFSGHDMIVNVLKTIGCMQKGKENYNKALDLYRLALTMQENYYPSYYADIANTLNYIFDVLICQSKYNEALYYCQRALEMQESYYPSGNASIALSLNNIGVILRKQGKYTEAIDCFRRSLTTVEKYTSFDHYSIAGFMNNIGSTLCYQAKYNEALDYHRRALEIQEKYCSSCQQEIANTLNYIGNMFIEQKNYDETLKYC
ncbi:unnamed protein product [Rotaria sp. Silwood2]|nr:unnamed protein product [Rotaria sp. Silwood2]CAF4299116.1 unnamed protein product [Rotaria sp. Silwood2]